MKILTFSIIFVILTNCCLAQKQRLEGDDSRYLCLNDSVSEFVLDSIRGRGVDSIITVLYDYDNGRMQKNKRIVMWQAKGVGYASIIVGCDLVLKDSVFKLDLTTVWESINNMNVGQLTTQIKPYSYSSHGMGYHVTVRFRPLEFYFYVRDDQRKEAGKLRSVEIDPRIRIVNWIERALN